MDSTALKAQIDSQITNETSPNSISPADVGGNLKSVVDYSDQQAPIKSSGSLISEQWLSDGSLKVKIEINAGIRGNFLDRLGSLTKGSAQVKE